MPPDHVLTKPRHDRRQRLPGLARARDIEPVERTKPVRESAMEMDVTQSHGLFHTYFHVNEHLYSSSKRRIYMRIRGNELMDANSRKIIRHLEKDGFERVQVTGSHHKFKKGDRTVTVPHPKKDLPTGTVRNIYKQAGWL